MAVESERAAMLNDTKALHASTQQLRELRDTVAEEKAAVMERARQLEDARAAVRTEQAAAAAKTAAITGAERKIDELRMNLSQKRALISNETVKVCYPGTAVADFHCCAPARVLLTSCGRIRKKFLS